jgi:hypothetical protein
MYLTLLAFLAMTSQGRELWEARKHRIIFLNPVTAAQWMVSFNAIGPLGGFPCAKPDLIALLANMLVSHMRRQYGFEMEEANRMQNIMAAAISLLADGGKGQLTLAELPLLFVPSERPREEPHNRFVQSLIQNTSHRGTLTFWQDQWATWSQDSRRQWPQSTEGRVNQILFNERTRFTLCAAENGVLDFSKLVEDYWLFVNLPYAFLSDTDTTLLGNLIITRILYACMQRPPRSRPYRLILDEARFFNTGPLETILETSRAYNLWLTLVVQSINQLCRSREGRVDERLKETVMSLTRYFSIFHNDSIEDGELLARLMFPVTGQVPMGIRMSGDWEYLPIQAEQDEHRRRLMSLQKRERIFYDKLGTEPPCIWRTPDVIMDPPDEEIVQTFEAAHLQRIGRPVDEIRAEAERRQKRLREDFFTITPTQSRPSQNASDKPAQSRSHKKPTIGRSL